MSMMQVGLLGIAGTLLAVQFKGGKTEYGIYIAVAISLLILAGILGHMRTVLASVHRISELIHLDPAYLNTMLKMIGITYTAEFSAAICKDAGYQTIAVQIEMFGKILILMLSLPIVLTVLEMIGEFLR